MPKNAIDYSKCVIYCLVCNDTNIKDCYIGHATNLTKRRNHHKSCCRCSYNGRRKVYEFIKENGNFDNWSIVKIENYPCKTYDDAVMRERYWIEYYNATLNSISIRERPLCYNCNSFYELYGNCNICQQV